MHQSIKISILELGVVTEGQGMGGALADLVEHAQHAEKLGFNRIWLAEHHNMPSVSTAATAVLIGHVAGKTKHIRVGSGGIMLPNHTALAIAEQFGTLDLLYPGRIDLGLGRAPGTDQQTVAALRRNNLARQHDFEDDILALQQYFGNINAHAPVRAFPGEGQEVPLWILGSSTDSAYLAAKLGLPYAFASHFAPTYLWSAIDIYKNNFQPSAEHPEPYLMVAANIIVADSNEEADYLKTSRDQMVLGLITGQRRPLQPPVRKLPPIFDQPEVQGAMAQFNTFSFSGDQKRVQQQLTEFASKAGADELIVTNYVYDKTARLHSLALLAETMELQENTRIKANSMAG